GLQREVEHLRGDALVDGVAEGHGAQHEPRHRSFHAWKVYRVAESAARARHHRLPPPSTAVRLRCRTAGAVVMRVTLPLLRVVRNMRSVIHAIPCDVPD